MIVRYFKISPALVAPDKTCAEVGLPREVTLTLSYGVSRI